MWSHDKVPTSDGVGRRKCVTSLGVFHGWRDESPLALSPSLSWERERVMAGAGAALLVYEGFATHQES